MKAFLLISMLLSSLAVGQTQMATDAGSIEAVRLLPELTKAYREFRWSEFFGLAWYMKKVTKDAELTKKIATLESIALIRHCQSEIAKGQVNTLRNQKSPAFRHASTSVEKWLDLTSDTQLKKHTEDTNRFKGGLFKASESIPFAPGQDLSNLEPMRIRRPLKDLCEEEGSHD